MGDVEYVYSPPPFGDDERAQLTRTFSPPPPRSRPFPLVISHNSEETLHHINSTDSCDIGSAGSSHSSGFNESMLESLEHPLHSSTTYRPFNVDSPIISELDYPMHDEEEMKSPHHVFEGFGGRDLVDPMDLKDQHQLIKSLTHKNKVLTQERRELESQLEHQEDILERMEMDIKRIKREKKDVEKQKKEESGRMRLENKELEHSLEKLRDQRSDAENRLELMDQELEANKIQIHEVNLQLLQAIEEHNVQKERNNELIRQLENKERQMSSLADDYKQDSHLNMATQYRLEELNRENDELQRHVQQLKTDKEFLAGTLTKVTCELSRLKQGVPLSPTNSTNSSVTSPLVSYHALLPVFEEGDTLDDLLNSTDISYAESYDDFEQYGYINIAEIMEEREKLIQRNEMLEMELNDMKKLMCVVAPQHYIDDDAVEYNRERVEYTKPAQYTKPTQYTCFSPTNMNDLDELYRSQLRITPIPDTDDDSETDGNMSTATLADIPSISEEYFALNTSTPDHISSRICTELRSSSEHHTCEDASLPEPRTPSPEEDSLPVHRSDSRHPSDNTDSGVVCQSSTDAADANCASCCSWEPEKELMVSKMMTSQQVVDQLKSERDQLEYQLNQLQHPRWRGWIVHLATGALLLFLLLSLIPLFSHSQCKHSSHSFLTWGADFFSYKIVHLRDRTYNLPH